MIIGYVVKALKRNKQTHIRIYIPMTLIWIDNDILPYHLVFAGTKIRLKHLQARSKSK